MKPKKWQRRRHVRRGVQKTTTPTSASPIGPIQLVKRLVPETCRVCGAIIPPGMARWTEVPNAPQLVGIDAPARSGCETCGWFRPDDEDAKHIVYALGRWSQDKSAKPTIGQLLQAERFGFVTSSHDEKRHVKVWAFTALAERFMMRLNEAAQQAKTG